MRWLSHRRSKKILKQKKMYEESLGVSLTTIGFREHRLGQSGTQGALMLEEIIVTGARSEREKSSVASKFTPQQQPSFDEVEYNATLSVDFKIN